MFESAESFYALQSVPLVPIRGVVMFRAEEIIPETPSVTSSSKLLTEQPNADTGQRTRAQSAS